MSNARKDGGPRPSNSAVRGADDATLTARRNRAARRVLPSLSPGAQQKNAASNESWRWSRGENQTPVLLSLSRLPVFAPALDDQVQHWNEK
jgi:hypothetical protein